jgi:hypothetical protein
MSSGGLRRSINYACSRYTPEPFPQCPLCNEGDGRVRVVDRARDRVNLICRGCAAEFIEDYEGENCSQIISDLIAGKPTIDPDKELPTHWALALTTDDA